MYKIKEKIREFAKKITPLRIAVIYYRHVKKGLDQYIRIKENNGWEWPIISCAPRGTGDFYLMGLFFPEWLKQNEVSRCTIISCGKAEKRVLSLWPQLLTCCKTELITWEEYCDLMHFKLFLQKKNFDIHVFHHIAEFSGEYINWLWITWDLMGYKNLSQTDFYLNYGYCLPQNTKKSLPYFSDKTALAKAIFDKYDLQPHKTILLSPYSTGNTQLPAEFNWSRMVDLFIDAGYTVCTNCFGDEQPIFNTIKVEIAYDQLVPFLDMAGYCIGIRSGFMDIISSSKCKTFIIHTFYANHWPNGNSLAYTGVKNMNLNDHVFEYQLLPNNENALKIQYLILKEFHIVHSYKKYKRQKIVKIKYVDVPPDFDQERHWITRTLRNRYVVIFSEVPDFYFISVLVMNYKKI